MRTVGLGAQKKEPCERETLLARIAELETENAALRKKSKPAADKKAKAETVQNEDVKES